MVPADFKALFPEFTSTADNVVQAVINLSDPYFDPYRWDDLLFEGQANWVAHTLYMNAQRAANPTSAAMDTKLRKKVGEVESQQSELVLIKAMDKPFMRTLYGQRYLELRAQIGSGGIAV